MVGSFWIFALLWLLYAVAPSRLALGAILAAFWVVDEVYDVAQLSYRLALIPDVLLGRMNGAFRLLFSTCETLSLTLIGLLLQQIGVLATIICFEVSLVARRLRQCLTAPCVRRALWPICNTKSGCSGLALHSTTQLYYVGEATKRSQGRS